MFICMFFLDIMQFMFIFSTRAVIKTKTPVDLFYIGDYTSPVIYIFYIAYD